MARKPAFVRKSTLKTAELGLIHTDIFFFNAETQRTALLLFSTTEDTEKKLHDLHFLHVLHGEGIIISDDEWG